MPKIEEICAALKVLSEAKARGELMMAPEVGERLGMTAQHAGPLLGVMYERKLAEKPELPRRERSSWLTHLRRLR